MAAAGSSGSWPRDWLRALALLVDAKHADAVSLLSTLLADADHGMPPPATALLHANRAVAYASLGMHRKVLKDCDAALALDPSCLRAYISKGDALWALGRRDPAVEVWSAGCRHFGHIADMTELVQRVRTPGPPSDRAQSPAPTTATTPAAEAMPALLPTPFKAPVHGWPLPRRGTLAVEAEVVRESFRPDADADVDVSPSAPSQSSAGVPLQIHAQGTVVPPAHWQSDHVAAEEAAELVARQRQVQFGSGNVLIDKQIAVGYLHVNTGKLAEGIAVFDAILQRDSTVLAAYRGRGTAFALSGNLPRAIADFTSAIKLDAGNADAWKRRGQARAALGEESLALADLTQAIKLDGQDAEALQQRALVYHKAQNYRKALPDFEKVVKLNDRNRSGWTFYGLCLNALGDCDNAIRAYLRVTELYPDAKEGYANAAQAYKDMGNAKDSARLFAKALALDPAYHQALFMRAQLRYGSGDIRNAAIDFADSNRLAPGNTESLAMEAVCYHSLGLFHRADAAYDKVLALASGHTAWHQQQVMRFQASHIDKSLCHVNMDQALDPYFKEAWCKKLPPTSLIGYVQQPRLSSPQQTDVAQTLDSAGAEGADVLVRTAIRLGRRLQYATPGFLANKRQHRMAGLAILDTAQQLQRVWQHMREHGTAPCLPQGMRSSGASGTTPFSWRDMYDIAVKWRQYSEPNDPVWWVDLLSPEQFAEGFGSQTPMVSGQLKVVRYYPYFSRAFSIVKSLVVQQIGVTQQVRHAVASAKTCDDLYSIMQRDFWVVTPCESTARPGKVMEGTRLTLVAHPPDGYDFSIRTPGTPPRHLEYDDELAYVWTVLSREACKPEPNMDKVADLILTMTFYWYNFMPLSRGTAAVGYIVLQAMFLAFGYEIDTQIKHGVQCDWEAILRSSPRDFIQVIRPWMYPARRKSSVLAKVPCVADVFPSIRTIITALNASVENEDDWQIPVPGGVPCQP